MLADWIVSINIKSSTLLALTVALQPFWHPFVDTSAIISAKLYFTAHDYITVVNTEVFLSDIYILLERLSFIYWPSFLFIRQLYIWYFHIRYFCYLLMTQQLIGDNRAPLKSWTLEFTWESSHISHTWLQLSFSEPDNLTESRFVPLLSFYLNCWTNGGVLCTIWFECGMTCLKMAAVQMIRLTTWSLLWGRPQVSI